MGDSTSYRVGDRLVDAWGNDVEEDEAEGKYSSMSAKDLIAEVNKRNEDRADEDKITFEGKPKKTDVVDALEKDDEESDNEEE